MCGAGWLEEENNGLTEFDGFDPRNSDDPLLLSGPPFEILLFGLYFPSCPPPPPSSATAANAAKPASTVLAACGVRWLEEENNGSTEFDGFDPRNSDDPLLLKGLPCNDESEQRIDRIRRINPHNSREASVVLPQPT
ncbi:MAG: hypothetical protein HYZ49_01215 [Chloroflexi bacterium]|nr:hypothetical protein [Chloroflexota bacterium]